MAPSFQIAALSPGWLQPSVVSATHRAGGIGVLDFEYVGSCNVALECIHRYNDNAKLPFGVKVDADSTELLDILSANLPAHLNTVLLTSQRPELLRDQIQKLRRHNIFTLVETTSLDHAERAAEVGPDAIVAKGHEAGGRIGEETTFILLQKLVPAIPLPIWAHGGIGLHTVAACAAAGAMGAVLDAQLLLARESPLSDGVKSRIASMDGSETICLGSSLQQPYRFYYKPGSAVIGELQEAETRLGGGSRCREEIQSEWRRVVKERAGWETGRQALLLGQDSALATGLSEKFRTVGGIVHALREAVRTHCEAAVRLRPLDENTPLALSNGTRYPILQGPMTRVSDVPEFAARVSEQGGLPFLAIALLRAAEVRAMLAEARQRLGPLPWGVGILGFVPPELRQEQIDVITEFHPPFALIAGGRPDQAKAMEQKGIATYLHVPSPGLLRLFVQQGARRFVFEGRECGGHIGPRTSFVLWNQMVDVLLSTPEVTANPEQFEIVFAAGIHDARSAAMVSVIAAPLAERGMKIGALLGTAYLFTKEAVEAGAILETFQEQALECRNTVTLESGPGHSTRCVDSPFAAAFLGEKQRLLSAGKPAEEIRLALEDLNLGRLRIASKGVARHPKFGQDPEAPRLIDIDKTEQVAQGMYMIGQVAALRDRVCTIAELHHSISVGGSTELQRLAGRFCNQPQETAEAPSDIAIIGMSCLLPKAPTLEAYWENILNKVDATSEVPKDRWDWQAYFDADPKAKDKIYSRWGGFLDDVAFDPTTYGMPPSTLNSIEPAQLLTLEAVRAALTDAGYANRPFPKERTSVILGAGGGAADLGLGYGARSFLPMLEELPEFQGRSAEIMERLNGRLPEWTEDSFAGILTNVAAGRVANRFDLGGSNYTIDAACASSLAAVSHALKELEGRTSDMVIVGGVDTMQNPFTYLCFSKTHALSPRGRCRTFDETADGIAISEGVAILVLKRLADAERDGDRIYAVIKAAGSSSDGKDRGLTAPSPEGQAKALERAYAKAGFSPATVRLVEAHGTGTVAGDMAEVRALTKVFAEAGAPQQACAIGSVKSMIGHTKCTAGAAGLVKTALALHRRVLPPTLGVDRPNPNARFPETPFFVNTESRPWLESPDGQPRRAGVSAFGFGGTNFHVVLEEYTGDPQESLPAALQRWSEELFVWKAESQEALREVLSKWAAALAIDAEPALRDLAYTSWQQAKGRAGRNAQAVQLAIVASSFGDLKQKLESAIEALAKPEATRLSDPRGIYYSQQPLAREGKIAFLFPGQGSQYPGMLQDLLIHFPEVRGVVEQASRVLRGKLDRPLESYVFPPSTFSREEQKARQEALTQTHIAQPALGAVSLALFEVLREMGLHPSMAAGHSYGEYTALAAAGVFDADTLMEVSEARGRFITEDAGETAGVMAAVEADGSLVSKVLQKFEGVCLANANSPRQSVISGSRVEVERAVESFSALGINAKMIPVACAFHSPLVAAAQPRLAAFLSKAPLKEPVLQVYSNTTAAPYPQAPQEIADRLVDHLVKPVEFSREIEAMYEAGARIFVEVGPRGVLTNLVEQILGHRPKLAVASNQSGKPALTQLLHLLGQLTAQGCELNLDRLYRNRCRALKLETLQADSQPKPLAPSVWMVNGARATPLRGSSPRTPAEPVPVEKTPIVPSSAASLSPAENISVRSRVIEKGPIPPPPVPTVFSQNDAPTNTTPPSPKRRLMSAENKQLPAVTEARADGGVAQTMAQFQQMMTRFLETQKAVMLAYLGSEPASIEAAPVSPVGEATPAPVTYSQMQPATVQVSDLPAGAKATVTVQAAPVAVPVVAAAEVVPISVPEPAQPAGPSRETLTAQLLAIVSERTGYPPEMLDAQLDLEADLGIDSIKRVEILGTFQQVLATAGGVLEDGLMEKLSGARTLEAIIDCVAGQFAGIAVSSQRPAAVAVSPVAAGQPAAVTTAATLPEDQLINSLLAIVSERTGYPPEMLDLNLDLEADLGIDSIKRVEILGTLQQTFEAAGIRLEEGLMEKLSGARNLQGILDLMSTQRTPSPMQPPVLGETDADAVSVESSEIQYMPVPAIQRFTLRAVETPADRVNHGPKDRTILIAESHHPASRALALQLRDQGYRVAVVRQGESTEVVGAGRYTANFQSAQSTAEAINLIARHEGPLGGVVHMISLDGQGQLPEHNYESWNQQVRRQTRSLFHLAKATSSLLREGAGEGVVSFVAVTGMGGKFLIGDQEGKGQFPDHGAIAGLIKTLAVEWPQVAVKVVDVDPTDSGQVIAESVANELGSDGGEVEVGYRGSIRYTVETNYAPVDGRVSSGFDLTSSSVVLITGGARGITAIAAKKLAERYRPILVIAGRTPLPAAAEGPQTAGVTNPKEVKAALIETLRSRGETVTPAVVERAYARLLADREVKSNLEELRQLGATVHYHAVDVRDQQDFAKFVEGIYSSFGRLDGVIHGAGIVEDKLVDDKTTESFDRVFDTKVNSAFTLAKTLHFESLQFLVFYSSVTARFGNRGQADYAAANEVLNKLAACLDRDWPARVVAMNWGPWDTEGMVSDEVRRQFAERGVELIPGDLGVRRLLEELNFGVCGESEVVIGGARWVSRPEQQESRSSFPLLSSGVFSSREGVVEVVRELNVEHDLYLNDHRLDGRPVLPLAVSTELIAEVVSRGWPSLEVSAIRDLRMLQGIVLEKGGKAIRIIANVASGTADDPRSVTVEIAGTGQMRRAHYRAVVDLAQHLPAAPRIAIPQLTDGTPLGLSVPQIYNEWLFHGPLFQGISRLDQLGKSGISSVVRSSSPAEMLAGSVSGKWLVDPLTFDSALQLLLVWARAQWGMTALPAGFRTLRRFAGPVPKDVACEIRLRPETVKRTIHSDFYFSEVGTGRIFAVVEDMEGACSEALNRLAGGRIMAAAGS